MSDVQDLPALLADLTARQRQDPASRNRAITLYVVNNETASLTETFTSTTFTPPFLWADGSTSAPQAAWGEFEWAS